MASLLQRQMEARRAALRAKTLGATAQPAPTQAPARVPVTAPTEVAEAVAKALAPEAEAPLGKSAITFDMLNTRQRQAVTLFSRPRGAELDSSFVLDGPAGSGKTTTVKLGIEAALEAGVARTLPTLHKAHAEQDGLGARWTPDHELLAAYYDEHNGKVLKEGAPRVLIVSYTNVAVRNIREIVPDTIKAHTTTIHKAVGFHPVEEEYEVVVNGVAETKTRKVWIPKFGIEPLTDGGRGVGCGNKLPELDIVVIEEAGTVPVYLFKTLLSALTNPHNTRFVFLGDIEQLDPAFGDGILGYKKVELPTVHLTETYRNVGLVTQFAHRILTGKPIGTIEAKTWNREDASGFIRMRPFGKAGMPETMNRVAGNHFKKMILEGEYNEHTDVVLIPFNKEFGTIELNKWIMQAIAERDQLPVQEVIAGMNHHYFCIGDKVLVNKQYYKVEDLRPNPEYTGTTKPFPSSRFIDRWGRRRLPRDGEHELYEKERLLLQELNSAAAKARAAEKDVMKLLEGMAKDENASNQASHIMSLVAVLSSGEPDEDALEPTLELNRSAEFNSIVLPYALTVYKAQGSEFRNVHLILHQSHGIALKRELFYTGVTRARFGLTLYYSDVTTTGTTEHDTLTKAIRRQAIPGRTPEEKNEHFKKKLKGAMEKEKLLASARAARELGLVGAGSQSEEECYEDEDC